MQRQQMLAQKMEEYLYGGYSEEESKKLAEDDNRSAGMQITHLVEKEAKKRKMKAA